MIKEVIIVEGRDDEASISRAVEATTIATHGFGIKKETFDLIEKAYIERGLIIFTDPDFAGEKIRKRLQEKFPKSKHAYLTRNEANKNGDIGIENATAESIIEALSKARCTIIENKIEFTMQDMIKYKLAGASEASKNREGIGKILGIGYGNAKEFVNRLNQYGVKREEFEKIWTSFMHQKP
ncbi:ribonuclease M5 [Anaerovorax odorimutans]|uniref:ribonuclease M5 n=1 Tax=Anaerovorax odorimutans TaxID=109327 RepID=UPI000409D0A7|nr:ribonuclease M5 [Anaerovorax odorimutans]